MKNMNNDKSIIQKKLKEIMKLAKEIGVLSENYTRKNKLIPAYIIFNESSDEIKMLKSFFETYEIEK